MNFKKKNKNKIDNKIKQAHQTFTLKLDQITEEDPNEVIKS